MNHALHVAIELRMHECQGKLEDVSKSRQAPTYSF